MWVAILGATFICVILLVVLMRVFDASIIYKLNQDSFINETFAPATKKSKKEVREELEAVAAAELLLEEALEKSRGKS